MTTAKKSVNSWMSEWFLMASALTVFLAYSGWATLQGKDYIFGPYRSPFYPFDFKVGNLSPALLVFWIPVAFRLTCYYWRKTYYRTYFLDPVACNVAEIKRGYTGENAFPFILLNLHRYFVYMAVALLLFHWKETIFSFSWRGALGVGLGNILLLADSVLLTIYVFSCHSLRHLAGGKLNRFSCSSCGRGRYQAWKLVSIFNEHHGVWAWASLVTIIIVDLYIRFLAWGKIQDIHTWQIF